TRAARTAAPLSLTAVRIHSRIAGPLVTRLPAARAEKGQMPTVGATATTAARAARAARVAEARFTALQGRSWFTTARSRAILSAAQAAATAVAVHSLAWTGPMDRPARVFPAGFETRA